MSSDRAKEMAAKMSEKRDEADTVDTVPPPASGDAYSAQTVQRVVPAELLAEAKRDLMRRAPRAPADKRAAAAVQAPLRPAPLPHIDRLFADEDSTSDDDETVMRPMPPSSRAAGEIGGPAHDTESDATAPDADRGVRESPRVAEVVRHSTTSAFPSRPSSARSAGLGWPAAVLIFSASLVAVLLIGLVLMGFLVPR